jgi:hypothetical protein
MAPGLYSVQILAIALLLVSTTSASDPGMIISLDLPPSLSLSPPLSLSLWLSVSDHIYMHVQITYEEKLCVFLYKMMFFFLGLMGFVFLTSSFSISVEGILTFPWCSEWNISYWFSLYINDIETISDKIVDRFKSRFALSLHLSCMKIVYLIALFFLQYLLSDKIFIQTN